MLLRTTTIEPSSRTVDQAGGGDVGTRPSGRVRRASRSARGRLMLVALGGCCLLAGLNAALVRLDVWAPVVSDRAADVHGLVMVYGFLGTLISLERAQSLGRSWGYLTPALYAVGALALLTPAPTLLGHLLLVEAGVLFVAVYVALWRRAPRPLVAVQVLSSVLALGGAVVAIGGGVASALPWLIGFLVLTIAAERADLAQLSIGASADRWLLALASGLVLSIIAGHFQPAAVRLVGVMLIATAGWLLANDVVRRQLRSAGQRRYVAVALLAGYLNLFLAGAVLAWFGVASDRGYDVVVHGVFLGFGVSMVMAHAPIILPAVLGRDLPYHRALWVPLGLLHAGLVVRFAGALGGWDAAWRVGGVVTVLAMVTFALTAVTLVVRR